MITNFITRFAPSPTGRLHLGHAWSAMHAFDRARACGGQFLLRIEDIDQGRCRAEYVDSIFEDLRWLGLDWDGEALIQSQRSDHHKAALHRLQQLGVVYRCWCTRAEIAARAGAPHGGVGPHYPGTCRGRSDPDDTRPHCWRLDVAKAAAITGPLVWTEADKGDVIADPGYFGDVVIARKDGETSYHLAVTVDDAAIGVTDVVRGIDLFASTHIHRMLQSLLGLPTPFYRHHTLVVGSDGERLAKRKASPTIESLRNAGVDPRALMKDLRSGVFPIGFDLTRA